MSNMGAFVKEKYEKFAQYVLNEEFPDWSYELTDCGGICIRESKIVYIDKSYIGRWVLVGKEHILHECAHIKTVSDKEHGKEFYKEYVRLLEKFMI